MKYVSYHRQIHIFTLISFAFNITSQNQLYPWCKIILCMSVEYFSIFLYHIYLRLTGQRFCFYINVFVSSLHVQPNSTR